MTSRKINLAAGLAGVAVGGVWLYLAMQLTPSRAYDYDFFPKIYATGLILASLYVLFAALRAPASDGDAISEDDAPKMSRQDLLRMLGVLACAVLYVSLLPVGGYLICTILLLAVTLLIFGNRKPLVIVPVSIAVPVVIYVLFTRYLNVFLP